MRRLREDPTDYELRRMYAQPHDANKWGYGHRLRVDCTIALGKVMRRPDWVVDLSCGNAEIPDALHAHFACGMILGDFAPGYQLCGDISETIPQAYEQLGSDRKVLFVCSETIEHVADPASLLSDISLAADELLLSTPLDDPGGTPEHIWSFSVADIEGLMDETGWIPVQRVDVILGDTLSYQIHTAVRF